MATDQSRKLLHLRYGLAIFFTFLGCGVIYYLQTLASEVASGNTDDAYQKMMLRHHLTMTMIFTSILVSLLTMGNPRLSAKEVLFLPLAAGLSLVVVIGGAIYARGRNWTFLPNFDVGTFFDHVFFNYLTPLFICIYFLHHVVKEYRKQLQKNSGGVTPLPTAAVN